MLRPAPRRACGCDGTARRDLQTPWLSFHLDDGSLADDPQGAWERQICYIPADLAASCQHRTGARTRRQNASPERTIESQDCAFHENTQTSIGATMRLRDKSAIITGAASGVGKNI